MKITTFFLCALLGIAAAVSVLAIRGIIYDGRHAAIVGAFRVLGDRAIQLDRIGAIGMVRTDISLTKVKADLFYSGREINCSSEIQAEPFDPKTERSVEVILTSVKPIEGYLVYSGKAPDFAAFLNDKIVRSYFEPKQYFNSKNNNKHIEFQAYMLADYDQILKGRRFDWHSTECSEFTFTQFQELKI